MVGLDVGRDLSLPFGLVVEPRLLVVEQFLLRLRGELEVGALHDAVHRAGLLVAAALAALGLVDVIAGGPAGDVGLTGDGLVGTEHLAKLAHDAALLSSPHNGWVVVQCMLPVEARTQRAFLRWVVDGGNFP